MCDRPVVGWFGDQLRQVMDELGVSNADLGRRLETDGSHIRKWKRGQVVPSVEKAAEIAAALRVPAYRLCIPAGAVTPTPAEGSPGLTVEELGDAARAAGAGGAAPVDERDSRSGPPTRAWRPPSPGRRRP